MSVSRFYLVFWLTLVIHVGHGYFNRPAVIGQRYTIISTASVPSDAKVLWELKDTRVVLYDSSRQNPNPYPNLYIGSRTQLTLMEVSKDDETRVYQHIVNGNIVSRFTLPLCDPMNVTLKIGTFEMILDTDSSEQNEEFQLDYTPDMTDLTFCAHNMLTIGFVQIKEREEILVRSTTSPCVSIPLSQGQSRMLIMSFAEYGKCERTGSYTGLLKPVFGQYALPILQLYAPDINNVIRYSGCKNGLIDSIDFFTVRGKVHKNGSNPGAFIDTNMFFEASKYHSTNMWIYQCRPDLSVCGSYYNKDCYCERKDPDGYYHLKMKIKAKSMYSGGKLMLSWNNKLNEFSSPIVSNAVMYYPGTICGKKTVTLKTGSKEMTLDTDPSTSRYTNFQLDYTSAMTRATFCVYNLRTSWSIQMVDSGSILAKTTTTSCVSISLTINQYRVLTMTFTESGGCGRTGSYKLTLGQPPPPPPPPPAPPAPPRPATPPPLRCDPEERRPGCPV